MSLFAKLFNKNTGEVSSKNVEDFVSLTRVYFQSVIAANLGITNIRFVPDVANFKRLFKIPTQGGRLGQAEKAASLKLPKHKDPVQLRLHRSIRPDGKLKSVTVTMESDGKRYYSILMELCPVR